MIKPTKQTQSHLSPLYSKFLATPVHGSILNSYTSDSLPEVNKNIGERVKVTVNYTCYSASGFLWGNLITEALRYGTRCKGSYNVTCIPTRSSANGMNHAFDSQPTVVLILPTPEEWKAKST